MRVFSACFEEIGVMCRYYQFTQVRICTKDVSVGVLCLCPTIFSLNHSVTGFSQIRRHDILKWFSQNWNGEKGEEWDRFAEKNIPEFEKEFEFSHTVH